MKHAKLLRGAIGLLFLISGFLLARHSSYPKKIYLLDAGGCRLETEFLQPRSGPAQGTVVLLHGLSANKKLMEYLAAGFAEQGLQVILPDLPGHGHTQGPFSAARADECTESLMRELLVRGIVQPERTILAGHSMGGAVAIRVAARLAFNAVASVPLAGVIAISPAPMKVATGVSAELLLYRDPPALPPNTLIVSGGWETSLMKKAAADLVQDREAGSAKYVSVPHATHVSLLFDSRVSLEAQQWAAQTLHLSSKTTVPSHRGLWGALAGLLGVLILVGPFLDETVGGPSRSQDAQAGMPLRIGLSFLVLFAAAFLAVEVLHVWNPFQNVRVFEADYFAGFLVFVAFVVLLAKREAFRAAFSGDRLVTVRKALAGAFAGMVTLLLLAAWFELTLSEAWWKADRWARFPLLIILLLPYHLAEELVLGPVKIGAELRRLGLGFALRLAGWSALLFGVLVLHSGEMLLVLLAPYLFVFYVLQRRGMDVVRGGTGSPLAAAIFGAILLAGFCLVTFPIT